MNRRTFLIGAAQATLGGLVTAVFPRPAVAAPRSIMPGRERVLQGTPDGKILEYLGDTRTWRVNFNLGPGYSVGRVFRRGECLYAIVRFQEREFVLKSADGARWYTLEWARPGQTRQAGF